MATSPKDTSLSSAFRYAIDQPLENMATTFQALGMEGWEEFMRDLVEEPENYEAAAGKFINAQNKGFKWEYFPRAVFEQAGQIAGSLLARGGGAAVGTAVGGPVGMAVGALLGPTLFEAVQIAGPVALERAKNNDREEPNWDDWKGALGTSAASGVLNAIGIKNVGVLNNIGKGALKQAGKQIVKGGVSEGVTEGFQGAAEQVGGSALTEAGLQFDPKAAVGEGFLGLGAGTGTQVGTEILGQVAPPAQDGALYSNPFTKLFGKKKEAPEPTPVPEITPEEELQAKLDKQEAENMALAKEKYPGLSEFFMPQEIDLLGTQIGAGTENMMSAQDIEALVPKILDRIGDDIKQEDVADVTQDIVNHVIRHPAEFTEGDYDGDPSTRRWNQSAIAKYTDNLAYEYYAVEKSEEPGKYEFDTPRDLYNQPPPVVADYTVQTVQGVHQDDVLPLGSVQQVYTPETAALMRNSPKGSLSTTFMSHSPLEKHIKSQIPKKPISAEEAMKKLFIELGEGKGRAKHGKFKTTDQNKDRLATEAIEAKLGDFLLDRMNAKEEKDRSVTRQELLNVLQDHRSGFNQVVLSDRGRAVTPENYRTSANPDIEAWRQGKFAQYMVEEVKKSEVLPEGYDPSKADAPTDPLPNGEDRFFNEFVDVVEPKVKKRVKEAEKGLPGLLPFLPPVDPRERAREPFTLGHGGIQTFNQFRGEGQPALRRVGEDMEIILRYDARVSPDLQQEIQEAAMEDVDINNPNSFVYGLAEANKLKRKDPAYHKNPSGHGWAGSGTLGWSRGGMFSHGEGFKGYLMAEIQSGIHGKAQSKKYEKIGYRSKKKKGKMNAPDRRKLRTGNMLNQAAASLKEADYLSRAPMVVFRALFPELDAKTVPEATGRLIATPLVLKKDGNETMRKPLLPLEASQALVTTFASDPGKGYSQSWSALRKKMEELEKTLTTPTYKKNLKKEILEYQPLRSLGIEFKDDAQLDTFLTDSRDFVDTRGEFTGDWSDDAGRVPGGSSQEVLKALVDAEYVPKVYQADAEVLQVVQDYFKPVAEVAIENSAFKHIDTTLKTLKPFAQELVAQDSNMGLIYQAIKNKKAPGTEEFRKLEDKVSETSTRESDMRADYPLKGTFGRAKLQADIVSTLMHDPDVTHIYIPTASEGGGPTSPYKLAIKEADKIAKAFGLDFKELTEAEFTGNKYNEETGRYETLPVKVYALEIAPLRERIIEEGGFPGYQKGGLVKKATNQVLNYGDYGRRFI
jgi:hypothetical protein